MSKSEQETAAPKKITVLAPAFYTLQATVCEEWAEEFQKKSDICLEWSELLRKASGVNTEWVKNYEAWSETFLKQARVCKRQARMASEAATKVIL